MELQRATSEVITHIVDDQGKENAWLGKRIVEPEATLSPKPLFSQHISIIQKIEDYFGHA